jgi:hypothetical protein
VWGGAGTLASPDESIKDDIVHINDIGFFTQIVVIPPRVYILILHDTDADFIANLQIA